MGRSPRWLALTLVGVVLILGTACSGEDDMAESAGGEADMSFDSGGQASEGRLEQRQGGADTAAPASRSAMDVPSVGPSIVKTADVHVKVEHDGFQDSFQSVVDLAQRKGGFILSSDTSGDDARSGSITLRVPADVFESTLNEVTALGRVEDERISAEDVSQEFIDLEARLRNLSAQEAVMLRLMDRANTITGTIRVQNELTGVQLEIERLRGRLRFLEDQTAFSTITVRLSEAGVVAPAEPGTLARSWEVARETTSTIVSGILIGGAALAPIAMLLLLAFLVFRLIKPRLGRIPGA
jgi:hypothetical protein